MTIEREREELEASLEASSSPSLLHRQQSGSQEWQMLRSARNNPTSFFVDMNSIWTCVHEHIKEIILALGELLKSTKLTQVTRL
jgi:uncharacterized protein with HEPN domain